MSFSYLTKSTHIFIILFLVLTLSNGLFFTFLLLSVFYGAVLYLFRKPPQSFRDKLIDGNDTSIFSPVSGKVMGISHDVDHQFFGPNLTRVQIALPPLKDMGIYLPVTSEIIDKRVQNGDRIFRYNALKDSFKKDDFKGIKGVSLILQNLNKDRIGISIAQCKFGAFPNIAVLPGDRGLRGVNIGNTPFGGPVFLYFSDNFNTALEVGSNVKTGQTVVANKIHDGEQVNSKGKQTC